jgi:hypothetical protein
MPFLGVSFGDDNLSAAVKSAFRAYVMLHGQVAAVSTFDKERRLQRHVDSLPPARAGFGCFSSWYCHNDLSY